MVLAAPHSVPTTPVAHRASAPCFVAPLPRGLFFLPNMRSHSALYAGVDGMLTIVQLVDVFHVNTQDHPQFPESFPSFTHAQVKLIFIGGHVGYFPRLIL